MVASWGGDSCGCGVGGSGKKVSSFISSLGSKTLRVCFCSAESETDNQSGGEKTQRGQRSKAKGHVEEEHSSAEGESAAQEGSNHIFQNILKFYYLKM